MASLTNCEGVEFVQTLSTEIASAISVWTDVACKYEMKTEETLVILGQYFLTKNQFVVCSAEVKFYIEKGLSETDREVIDASNRIVKDKKKSPEKKALMESRSLVKRKVNKIYNRLLQELFPSFLPPPMVDTIQSPPPPMVDTIPSPAPSAENPTTPPRARRQSVVESVPLSEELLSDDEVEKTDEIDELVDQLGSLEVTSGVNPRFDRSRFGNTTTSLPQDLFETPYNVLVHLDEYLVSVPGKIIYEPCCGNGAITKFLESRGFTVVARDLYTTEEKHDYLASEDPEYDILITNPRKSLCFISFFFSTTNHNYFFL